MQQRRQLRFLLCVIYNAALPQRATPQWYCCARREFNHYRARMDLIIIGRRLLSARTALLGRETICKFSCAEKSGALFGPSSASNEALIPRSESTCGFRFNLERTASKNWAPRIERQQKKPCDLSRRGSFKYSTRSGHWIERRLLQTAYSNFIYSEIDSWFIARHGGGTFQVSKVYGEEFKWNFDAFCWGWWGRMTLRENLILKEEQWAAVTKIGFKERSLLGRDNLINHALN